METGKLSREVLVESIRASVEALKLAVELLDELKGDYLTTDHQRWEIAYRWVVAANELVWHCRELLISFDDKTAHP